MYFLRKQTGWRHRVECIWIGTLSMRLQYDSILQYFHRYCWEIACIHGCLEKTLVQIESQHSYLNRKKLVAYLTHGHAGQLEHDANKSRDHFWKFHQWASHEVIQEINIKLRSAGFRSRMLSPLRNLAKIG